MAESFDGFDRRRANRAFDGAAKRKADYNSNPYTKLAYLPLRQVEQLLLAGFCTEELSMGMQQRASA